MNAQSSLKIELSVMRVLCKRIRSRMARTCLASLERGSFSDLCSLEINPSDYSDASSFSNDYLIYSFLRKWKGLNNEKNAKRAAISSWTTAEQLCFTTNARLSRISMDHSNVAQNFIGEVQRKIIEVIGLAPPRSIWRHCGWGPGATFDIKRSPLLDAPFKMSSKLTCTRRALPHFVDAIDNVWSEFACFPTIVRGNRCVTVAKSFKTDRMIACEPTVNAFLQKAVGTFMKNRLEERGVTLRDQTPNQESAFRAQVDGLATIDLSMASDTLCRNLVHLLLPKAWCDLLEDLRSPFSLLSGKWYELSKFSSMGNGYTFELESLIFFSIIKAVIGEDDEIRVFGDDLIVRQSHATSVVKALEFFGFSVNKEKSFVSGNFFESCGKHYFDLEDVTPVYQKEDVKSNLSELIRLHNRLYRWGLRCDMGVVKDALKITLEYTAKRHPKLKRLPLVPVGADDRGFYSNELKPRRDGDYDCLILDQRSEFIHGIVGNEIKAAYSLKLRDPITSNISPDGHYCIRYRTTTLLRSSIVWRSTLC